MKAALIRATMLSVLTASASYAATDPGGASRPNPDTPLSGEGALGGQGVKVAGGAASTFLFVREAAQSPLVTVGEGGEGRRGRRLRGDRFYYRERFGRQYNYYRGERLRRFDPRLYDRPYYGRPYYERYYYDRYYDRY
jgi:hypothetical protein